MASEGSVVAPEPPCGDEQKVTLLSESEELSSDSWHWPRKAAGTAAIFAVGLVVLALAARTAANEQGDYFASQSEVVMLAEDITFDCEAGYSNWQRGWSGYKKDWCCNNGKPTTCSGDGGDTMPAPFDCEAGGANWDAGWAVPKKIWCCQNGKYGCGEPNVLKVNWVHANVNYDILRKDGDMMKAFKETSRSTLTQHLRSFQIPDKDVSCVTWAGSALHSTGKDANTGVVVRCNVTLPKASDHSLATAKLNDPSFVDLATRNAEGVVLSICNGRTPTTHDVTVEPPIVSPCTCENGEPAEGATCSGGGNKCKQCEDGYHLTDCFKCEENVCTCAGGMPAKGTACPEHSKKKCLQCRPGFHYEPKTQDCSSNVCRCDLGFPATGASCSQHQAHMCGSCYPGYDVDETNKECVAKDCVCTNGYAVSSEKCPANGAEKCENCNDGFHVDSEGFCKMNTCRCPHGQHAVGPNCPKHDKEWCVSCKDDMFLHEGQCSGDKECICKHGTPVGGNKCTTNHATICERCDAGYTLSHGQCVTLRCVCDNGVPADDDDTCTTQGGEVCLSCNDGYHLEKDFGKESGKCKPRECKCHHGKGAVGKECASDGAQSCAECDAGYHQKLKTVEDKEKGITRLAVSCKANTCTCEDDEFNQVGIPAVGEHQEQCYQNNANVCVRCDSNYRMVKNECIANKCTCSSGTPVDVKHCRKDGDHNCKSCKSGFWLAQNETWEEEVPVGQSSVKPTYKKTWDSGRAVCLPDARTTVQPFDCMAGADKWELGWSPLKRHWCCLNQQIGCIPKETAEDTCEDQGFTSEQCANIGCCQYTNSECKARTGWEKDVCTPSFRIVSEVKGSTADANKLGGKCAKAVVDSQQPNNNVIIIEKCDTSDVMQAWRPSEFNTGTTTAGIPDTMWQIRNGGAQCLELNKDFHGTQPRVTFERCADDVQAIQSHRDFGTLGGTDEHKLSTIRTRQNIQYKYNAATNSLTPALAVLLTGTELWHLHDTGAGTQEIWKIKAEAYLAGNKCSQNAAGATVAGTGANKPCMIVEKADGANKGKADYDWTVNVLSLQ